MWSYTNSDALYHYGVKGMKWGVRRYQNPDGSLTNIGKKRLASRLKKDIRSARSISSARVRLANRIDEFKGVDGLTEYRQRKSYAQALKAKEDYHKAQNEYFEIQQKTWRPVVNAVSKKYGRYEDLERTNNVDAMKKFDAEYKKRLDSAYKKHGVYDAEKRMNAAEQLYKTAVKNANDDIREFISDVLGKYGEKRIDVRYSNSNPRKIGVSPALELANGLTYRDFMYVNIDDHYYTSG